MAGFASIAAAVAVAALASNNEPAEPAPEQAAVVEPASEDQPIVAEGRRVHLTTDGQVKSIEHPDEKGHAVSDLVHTPQGVVTIQRTFSDGGVLLKEEAFLGGRPVPVPAR